MEVSQPFPILKLPFVALWNVIKSMERKELIDLSFTSKRLVTIIKSIPIPNSDIEIGITNLQSSFFPQQNIQPLIMTEDLQERIKHLGGKFDFNESTGKEIIQFEYSKAFIDYICALYRSEIFAVQIDVRIPIPLLTSVLEWMNDRQPVLTSCLIYGDCKDNETIDRFFQKRILPIRQLHLNLKLSPEAKTFNFGILEMEEFTARHRDINTLNPIPNWITVETVLTSNCIIMCIGASPFTVADLKRIIKGWINGNNPRMEYFHVEVKKFNLRSLLKGIEYEKRETTFERMYIPKNKSYKIQRPVTKRTISGGYDIRRSDGTVATFQVLSRPQNPTALWKFVMVIWKKTVDS
ncbi:hypothetical protein CRE_03466 [Caenorhabditis remanei]|uniref:F-box domain-containing protein n=1 Tax=Caenorhabditis remanei TaxID=31234 RepID=E3NGP0_CAERE|nr:hypothetical protein CRE_03466 [Caenorhabditis remanei]